MTGERFRRSMEWLKRAEQRVPGASQTFSKGANQFVRGASPLFLERGKGARITRFTPADAPRPPAVECCELGFGLGAGCRGDGLGALAPAGETRQHVERRLR